MADKNIFSARPVVPGHLLHLERPRIDELFDKALKSPVVLVIGGAGYGKTHAVYSYLQKRGFRTVWMQFTERDNVPDRFWENFTQAIFMISKGTAEKLAQQGFPSTAQRFEQYLAIPLEDVDPRVRYVFVYDDLHLIHDKAVMRFLEHSITTPFSNITSILISRKELAFNLVSLFSKGLLMEINEEDLRFRKEEIEALFAIQNISASAEILDSVYGDTEGWAFAVQLAGAYLKNISSESYKAQVLHSNIYQLIESEVMAKMSPELRKFLIKLTLIDEASPELVRGLARLHVRKRIPAEDAGPVRASAVHDEKKAELLIRQIEEIGSFVRFDEYRNVVSIHRLFRDYLGGFQDELSDKDKTEVYLAAADWCAANNRKLDAITFYEKTGNYDKLITQILTLPMAPSDKTLELLIAVMERAPLEIYSQHEQAYTILTRLLFSAGRFEEAKVKLTEIIKTYEAFPESAFGHRVLAGCYHNMGFINKVLAPFSGDYSFPEYFAKGRLHYEKWGGAKMTGPVTVAGIGAYACRVGSGNPADMARFLAAETSAVPNASVSMGGSTYGMDDLARGELAFFSMNPEEAEGCLREALRKARECHQYEIEGRASFYLIRTGIFQGNVDLIKDSQHTLISLLENREYINRYVYHDIYRGWFYAHLGKCGMIAPWLRLQVEEEKLNSLFRGPELLVKARSFFHELKYTEALFVLKQAASTAGNIIFGKIEIKVLEALCFYRIREKEKAYASLEEGRVLAEPGGLYAPFAETGKVMRALADSALKDEAAIPTDFLEKIRNLSSAYAKKYFLILNSFSAGTDRTLSPSRDGTLLSRKEHDVLTALFQGFTQDEIAASTSRSVNTVKSVIKRIYEKLGAINRADAIRIAMSKGLLGWTGDETVTAPESPKKKPLLPGFNSDTVLFRKK
jgi:LuxR family maltose regulon positive regulatory protein